MYNQANIEKVRRDEAVAKAKEEAEEERMQELDAERRMQILRGEEPTPLPPSYESEELDYAGRQAREPRREKKKRKRFGENDTDFEMRIAGEQTQTPAAGKQLLLRKPDSDAPLIDHGGHINLFPEEQKSLAVMKKAEAERETAKKKKEYGNQYTVRFADAAGFKEGLDNPWYSKHAVDAAEDNLGIPSKDVWGNEDPRRKQREAARIVSNDPLAMMKQGAAKVRQVEKERKQWLREREREMDELRRSEKGERRKRRPDDDDDDDDDLRNFTLDASEKKSRHDRRGRDDSRRHSHHRRRSSEPDRPRHSSRH